MSGIQLDCPFSSLTAGEFCGARKSEQRLREVLVRAGDNHCAWFRKEADVTIDWSHFRQPGQIEEGK